MPPMDVYKFLPHEDVIDYNDHLSLAGSENEHRLAADGQNLQVALPPDFFDDQDLALIGAKFDPRDMDKVLHPELFQSLESRKISPTPTTKAGPVKTEEHQQADQQQLNYLKYLNNNPYLQNRAPVLKTETLYKTDILPIFDGVTTHYSTFSHPIGTTVRTDYQQFATSEVPQFPQFPPPYPNPLNPMNPFQPQIQTVSSPVTISTRVTSYSTRIYKITLQAVPIMTTVTSTKVYDTVLTTYVTQTVPSPQAAINPYYPFPGYFG
jgi:hypothetical protein